MKLNKNLRSLLNYYKTITPDLLIRIIKEYLETNTPLLIITKEFNYRIKVRYIDNYGDVFIGYDKSYIDYDKKTRQNVELGIISKTFNFSHKNLLRLSEEILSSDITGISGYQP